MQSTIFAILTDEQSRDIKNIKQNLDEDFSAGIPWYNEKMEVSGNSQ